MQYSTKRRVMLGMTTGGLLMTGLGMANAHADTTAAGSTSHSPGVGSGNLIQLPVNAPINVCGNQVDVIGILDSVTGNSCENSHSGSGSGNAGSTSASGAAKGSPGVGSGNLIQVPVNAPINICGNQIDVIGIGDTDSGNSCENHGGGSTTASGGANGSPGIVAGNVIQVPVNAPINVCGNQVDVIGILNSVTGNSCENNHSNRPQPSPTPTPTSPTPTPTQPSPTPTGVGCGCTPPPPPPPTTPCPPPGTVTPTPVSSGPSSAPATPPPTASSSSSNGGSNGGGSNGGTTGSSGGSSGKSTAVLAHTGSSALAFAPVGAGLIGGGLLLRRRFPSRSH